MRLDVEHRAVLERRSLHFKQMIPPKVCTIYWVSDNGEIPLLIRLIDAQKHGLEDKARITTKMAKFLISYGFASYL